MADAPFPLPAHRTGQADFPHPALGQGPTREGKDRHMGIRRGVRRVPSTGRPGVGFKEEGKKGSGADIGWEGKRGKRGQGEKGVGSR